MLETHRDAIAFLTTLPPLALKSRPATPALTLHPADRTTAVYVGRAKDAASSAQLFSPLSGEITNHTVDDMVATLSDMQWSSAGKVSRPPREAIVVLLDVSGSMDLPGFELPEPEPGSVTVLDRQVRVGDAVRIKKSVAEPRFNNKVLRGLLGKVVKDADHEGDVRVQFPGFNESWARASELEALSGRGLASMVGLSRLETVKQLFNAFA